MPAKITKKTIGAKPKQLQISVPKKRSIVSSVYEKDFYKWVFDQSQFLKLREYEKLDIDHLIEEIESLGNAERRALESYFKVLLLHLLIIKYQPGYRTKSWDNSVKASRFQINKLLEHNPSLNRKVPEIIGDAYYLARLKAADETSMSEDSFPIKCLWTFDECMKDAGLPAKAASKSKKLKK